MKDDLKIKVDSGCWLLPGTLNTNTQADDVAVGDLVLTGGRLSLVMKIKTHEGNFKKMIKLRWVGEDRTYWINFNTFAELYGGKVNEQKTTETRH